MNTAEKETRYSAEEFLSMTDLDGSFELIDGYIYDQASPSQEHQRIVKRITGAVDRYIEENKGECEVFMAPSDVKLDDKNVVQPDIFVVCDPNKLDGKKCVGAPDWIIEILSPSSIECDLRKKFNLYLEAGVREYWIVDPEEKKVNTFIFNSPKDIGIYTFEDEIPVGIYKNAAVPLRICISRLLKSVLA